jgi:hypothetical protein
MTEKNWLDDGITKEIEDTFTSILHTNGNHEMDDEEALLVLMH